MRPDSGSSSGFAGNELLPHQETGGEDVSSNNLGSPSNNHTRAMICSEENKDAIMTLGDGNNDYGSPEAEMSDLNESCLAPEPGFESTSPHNPPTVFQLHGTLAAALAQAEALLPILSAAHNSINSPSPWNTAVPGVPGSSTLPPAGAAFPQPDTQAAPLPSSLVGPVHPLLPPLPLQPVLSFSDLNSGPPSLSYASFTQQLQLLQNEEAAHFEAHVSAGFSAGFVSSTSGVLGPENPDLLDFLRLWARPIPCHSQYARLQPRPRAERVDDFATTAVKLVRYDDLEGDNRDIQGINWSQLGASRSAARERRLNTYKNYTNKECSDVFFPQLPDKLIPSTDNYFRFRRTDLCEDITLSHFQLRNVLACTSRTRSFFPVSRGIHEINPTSGHTRLAMDASEMDEVPISTIAAHRDLLIAGTFLGEYYLQNLESNDPTPTEGQITRNSSGITNHIQIYESRTSSGPVAAFASNDQGFRLMDVTTEKFISETMYKFPMNCSALSPDRRLRVLVGDDHHVLITNAETGQILRELPGHRDFGFACDWADDGWTIATGFQDMGVKIWDARQLSVPVTTIRSEMAGVRSLRFSPLGSGKRVLVAAEEADFINIIDARDFRSKQTFDVFSEIGGVAFTNGGQDLQILCCDPTRGGLIQLERCGLGAARAQFESFPRTLSRLSRPVTQEYFDWCRTPNGVVSHPLGTGTLTQRRRMAAMMAPMNPL